MFIHKINDELSLKLTDVRDSKQLFELTDGSRSYLKEWLPWLDFTIKEEDTKAFIEGTLRGFADHKSLSTVILFKGKIAGTAGFNSITWPNKTAYIGYWLGKDFQGNGIMTKVAETLTEIAFNEYGLNKVEIRAAVENIKSRSIPERLGYKHEGTIREAEWLYDHYVDHAVYGMLAREWEQKKHSTKKQV